ncbi:hypothetical protein BRADI_5g05767v3 [Brachypodium distachyon]|uniref:Uncharacterized protein n=1 Tax=Brachypodium distachyon TaxID=15368 RepID=A0A2K2CFM3_BRADI|nr:hypothetical protein BRADI_5g05767v3 [Brachypodium distachyon]
MEQRLGNAGGIRFTAMPFATRSGRGQCDAERHGRPAAAVLATVAMRGRGRGKGRAHGEVLNVVDRHAQEKKRTGEEDAMAAEFDDRRTWGRWQWVQRLGARRGASRNSLSAPAQGGGWRQRQGESGTGEGQRRRGGGGRRRGRRGSAPGRAASVRRRQGLHEVGAVVPEQGGGAREGVVAWIGDGRHFRRSSGRRARTDGGKGAWTRTGGAVRGWSMGQGAVQGGDAHRKKRTLLRTSVAQGRCIHVVTVPPWAPRAGAFLRPGARAAHAIAGSHVIMRAQAPLLLPCVDSTATLCFAWPIKTRLVAAHWV